MCMDDGEQPYMGLSYPTRQGRAEVDAGGTVL